MVFYQYSYNILLTGIRNDWYTDNNASSGAQSYGKWLIGISAVLILLFAVWYKYGNKNDKSEYTPLLSEEKVQYDQ